MARRLLSIGLTALALGAVGCRHRSNATPTPSPASRVAEQERSAHFASELKRAQQRWQEQPNLGDCAGIMHESGDIELCHAASSALSAVEQLAPSVTPESAIPALAGSSLSLARLLDRARYLTFEELGRRRLDVDAGAAAASASASAAPSTAALTGGPHLRFPAGRLKSLAPEHATLKITESPMTQLVDNAARIERDVLRNLGAYLEYAPLPVRRAAFDAAKQLQTEHPMWPALHHVLREATVLETDAALKRDLSELGAAYLPHGKRLDQPTGSK